MSALRKIEAVSFETPVTPARSLGDRGELAWIPIGQIVIDPTYQRDVGKPGKKNIRQIVEHFHWALFSPVIVARRGPQLYAAIDGQHRAIAAATHRGIKEVPCWIIPADPMMEALAFAVINGQVTALNPLHVFRAKVVAGDAEANAVMEVARAAGVTIMATPTSGAQLKHGETQSPYTIADCLSRFGREVTIAALRCITESGQNATMLKSVVIFAFAEVMWCAPKWRTDKKLHGAIRSEGLRAMYSAAVQAQADKGGALKPQLVAVIEEVLAERLGATKFIALPPTKAEIARKAAHAAGATKESLRRAGAAGAAVSNAKVAARPAKPVKPLKPIVSKDDRAAIADFIAKKGVRKLESGATGHPSTCLEYLQRRGVKIEGAQNFRYRYRGKLIDLQAMMKLVDAERAKENLPPLRRAG
jgi:hypothetical protein